MAGIKLWILTLQHKTAIERTTFFFLPLFLFLPPCMHVSLCVCVPRSLTIRKANSIQMLALLLLLRCYFRPSSLSVVAQPHRARREQEPEPTHEKLSPEQYWGIFARAQCFFAMCVSLTLLLSHFRLSLLLLLLLLGFDCYRNSSQNQRTTVSVWPSVSSKIENQPVNRNKWKGSAIPKEK